MKSTEFCYWLQGLFELADPKELSKHQVDLIKRHLNMVFYHEIDPSYPEEQQAGLTHLHHPDGVRSPQRTKPVPPDSVLLKC